eukprot:c21211_g1_i1 orf=705-2183(-)
MASPFRKEIVNCTSPGQQDTSQQQKKSARYISSGNMLSSFSPKETQALTEQGSEVFCKKDKAGKNGLLPWMDKVRKSITRSLFSKGFTKQRTSVEGSTTDRESTVEPPFERRACSTGKRKDLSFVKNQLKLLFNSSGDYGVLHHLYGHSVVVKGVKSEVFPVGVLLFQPLETCNLAEGLTTGVKKAGLLKKSVLGFARLQGEPTLIHLESSQVEELPRSVDTLHSEESQIGSPLRLHGMQLTSFLDLIPAQATPDKEKLNSVQDFFSYAEAEGKRVFEELDRDKDGKVCVDDIRAAMHKMKLPSSYARQFMHIKHKPWPANSIGWTEFASLMQEKEPTIIRLYNSLGVSKHGTIQRTHVRNLLKQHSFSVSDSTITAMMEALGGEKGSIKYGQFRRFMLLLPTEQLRSDPWSVWFKAAIGGAESEVGRGNVLKHVTVLSRNFVIHLDVAKGKVVTPDLPRVEDMSEFIRSTVKHVIHDPFKRVGADVRKIGG